MTEALTEGTIQWRGEISFMQVQRKHFPPMQTHRMMPPAP